MQMDLIPEADCSTSAHRLQSGLEQDGRWQKTLPVCSAKMTGGHLLRWLESWLGAGLTFQQTGSELPVWRLGQKDSSSGSYWMRSSREYRRGAVACSLSEILETGPVDRRYFLSPKACAGILRRAAKRGKDLPPALRLALEAVAGLAQTSTVTED
jgi:hypothetical protein